MNENNRDVTEMPYPQWTITKTWQPVTINVQ